MKHFPALIFISLLVANPLFAQTPTPTIQPSPPAANAPVVQPIPTAILKFQTSDDALEKNGAELATLLEAELSTSDHVLTVEREEIDKVLSEQELGASGLVSKDTTAKIGNLTGAKVLVTGRLFQVGNQFMAVAKIISSETSRVYGVTTTIADLNGLPQAAQDLGHKIDGVLANHRTDLLATIETPEQRLARLKALVATGPLPTISVSIPEQDYTQPTVDPAAQTEFIVQLQSLGFTIIDTNQLHKKADLAITGEAFSELGTRHGNLVSSRGRIELKLVRTANQELIWTDRQTEVSADLGTRTAGKEALEKAVGKLLERLVPKLTK
jgi:hypothetical protein